jgi:phosphate uptake regulator
MKRKIIRQGHNTLTITLPSNWVKRTNLESGDEVDVFEKGEGLSITSEKIGEDRKATFDITHMDTPTIWKYFMGIYREGYSEILVKFSPETKLDNPFKFFAQHTLDLKQNKETKKDSPLEALRGFVTRFVGIEITEYGKDYVLIKELGSVSSKEFDNSLRRVFLLVQQMAEETLDAIKTNNPKKLYSMHDVDISLDKFHDYCIRVLNKTSNKEPRKNNLLFSILYLLELLGDEFKNIANHLMYDLPESKFKSIIPLAEYVKEQIDLYYDLFYKFDIEKITKISSIDKKSYDNFSTIFNKEKSRESDLIFHHLRMIGRYINALIELRIEMEF